MSTSKKTESVKQVPVFNNVRPQNETLAQVTQYANPSSIKVDKDGTFRIMPNKK